MELLTRPRLADYVHYGIAAVGACACGALGVLAFQQTRILVNSVCTWAAWGSRLTMLADRAVWIVLGVSWAAYMLLILPTCLRGVTEGRIWRAQKRPIPEAIARRGVARLLWQNDLYHPAMYLVKMIWIPVVIYAATWTLNELIIWLI